ncbi:HSP97-like protein [Mya arenaria]|uniref:HSP97-like protein n=1 Tax=Mya arenaria TaxID=6604 RepID=A0ABY7DKC8_MYAAR|nr:HSP97-like protein [Mya arenaria]
MAVVGLDIGNFSSYVAVAAGGGIDTVANEYSDRCTPSYVSLNEKNRYMGMSAKNQATTNVKNTISCFKRLLGRKFDDPQVQREINHYFTPYKIAEYMGEMQQFTPEQLIAMLLTKLRDTGEKGLKTKVVDVVPCFYTDVERRAMIASCQMASLNCLKIMNDTTAVSLSYGIYKQDLPAENEKPRNVIFVDVGYSALQVCATAFNKGKLKVLAVQTDSCLGGRDFDRLLVHHFAEEWKTKYKVDAFSKPKAMIRLASDCEKLKKLMSANTQPIPIGIEAQFEEMVAPLLLRVEKVFKKILEVTKLSTDDIYSVEIVGGSSRVPCIKELVTKVFQKEPSTTLNADEAVAKGCALQCAILSPTFRVRDFAIQDCQQFPITLSWQGGGLDEDSSMEVFPEFHTIPFSKMLTFYRKDPFYLEARYSKPSELPIPDPFIGKFNITNVQPQANGDSSKVKVKVRINNNGMFTVQSASMVEKIEETQEEQGPESMETDAGKENNDSNSEAVKTEASMDTEQGPTPDAEQKADSKDGDSKDAESKDAEMKEEKKEEDKKSEKKKAKVKSIDLPVEAMVASYSKEAINLLVERENAMIMQDRLEKERCDAKNAVEEYVYDMRDKLCGPLETYSMEEDRENFSKLLGDTEEWLYDEGEDQNKQVYIDKLAELRKIGDPIQSRYRESMERPDAFNSLGHQLQLVRKFLDAVAAKDEKFSHLEKEDIEKVTKCLKEKQEWFDKQLNAQNKLKKHENPAVLASQIRQTEQSLMSTCNPVINKPKPKPKEEPPKDDKKDAAKDAKTDEQGNKTASPNKNANPAGDAKAEQANGPADMDVD